MPNWCDNSVTISGPKDQLNRIRKAVANGSLFEEFVPIPKDYPEHVSFAGLWGTKWDLPADEYTVHDHGQTITLAFYSAWSPPI